MGAITEGISELFLSFSLQGASRGLSGGGPVSWDGAGEFSLSHGTLSSQPTSCSFYLLPARKLRQGPAKVTAWASLTSNCPLLTSTLTWLGWALLPPGFAGEWSPWLSVNTGQASTPHPWGELKGLLVLAASQRCHGFPAQPNAHSKLWGPHTSHAPSFLPLPSTACPRNTRSHTALRTALFGQPHTHGQAGHVPSCPIPPQHCRDPGLVPITRPLAMHPAAWPSPETSAPAAQHRTCPPAREGAGPGGTRV